MNKDTFAAYCLVLPNMMRWLIMPALHINLTFSVLGVPFFWPCIFYIIYIACVKKIHPASHLKNMANIIWLMFLVCPLVLLFVEHGECFGGLYLEALNFYLIVFLFIYFPPREKHFKALFPFFAFVYLFLLVQMILSSFGLWDNATSEGDIFTRANTTAGDSNQSTIIFFIITIIITEYYIKSSYVKIITNIISLGIIAITATRGAFLSMALYMIYFLYIMTKGKSLLHRILYTAAMVIGIMILFRNNVFTDIIIRNEAVAMTSDVSSGRMDRWSDCINLSFKDSPLFGVGHGRVFPTSKDLLFERNRGLFLSQYAGAPHNVWILCLCEYGIFGIICMAAFVFNLLRLVDFKKMLSVGLLLVFGINMMTEACVIQEEILVLTGLLSCMSIAQSNKYVYE